MHARRAVVTSFAALTAVLAMAACGEDGPSPPQTEFLVLAGDSTFWVWHEDERLLVRGSPIQLARVGEQLVEIYVADDDRSFEGALLVGQRIFRRDLVTGDSALVFEDTTVASLASWYAREHPQERRLSPDEEVVLAPHVDVLGEVVTIDQHGPFLSVEYRVDGTLEGSNELHEVRRTVIDLRDGTPASLAELFGDSAAKRLAAEGATRFSRNVHRQGAGLVQIADAVLSTTKVEPGKLALGESQAGPATRTLTIENNGPAAVTYNLGHVSALATGPNTFVPAFFVAPASVAFSAPSVTVPAGSSATVDVTITAPIALADKGMYGGYIVITPQGGGQDVKVPYAGFKGDYQSIQVLVPTVNNYPWLARLVGTNYVQAAANPTYTLVGNDVPFITAHFDHHVREVKIEVFDAVSGKAWHRSFQDEYFPRNTGAATFFAFAFDGQTTSGGKLYTVPDGQYVLKLTVRKALGGPADFETWTSPVFNIDRP